MERETDGDEDGEDGRGDGNGMGDCEGIGTIDGGGDGDDDEGDRAGACVAPGGCGDASGGSDCRSGTGAAKLEAARADRPWVTASVLCAALCFSGSTARVLVATIRSQRSRSVNAAIKIICVGRSPLPRRVRGFRRASRAGREATNERLSCCCCCGPLFIGFCHLQLSKFIGGFCSCGAH